ncbi:hypothetical protein ACT1U9_01950 [Streptomyces sp. BR1]|uniref:hypothetical protein n=1 Tax=Streptomyces sp. BR1 TaxID=1592323 RepID=UPI00402BAE9B
MAQRDHNDPTQLRTLRGALRTLANSARNRRNTNALMLSSGTRVRVAQLSKQLPILAVHLLIAVSQVDSLGQILK